MFDQKKGHIFMYFGALRKKNRRFVVTSLKPVEPVNRKSSSVSFSNAESEQY